MALLVSTLSVNINSCVSMHSFLRQMEEEEDMFSQLSLKPAKVVGASTTAKKVPVLKAPQEKKPTGNGGILLPPPPPTAAQQAASSPAGPANGGGDILDFLSTSPEKPKPAIAPTATAGDDFDSLFGMSSSTPLAPAPAIATPVTSAGMTDDEFESFLSTVGPSVNK